MTWMQARRRSKAFRKTIPSTRRHEVMYTIMHHERTNHVFYTSPFCSLLHSLTSLNFLSTCFYLARLLHLLRFSIVVMDFHI
jgi:hypothetical protein